MALASGVAAGFFITRWMKPEYYKKRDSEKLEADLEKEHSSGATTPQQDRLAGSKLESIARKAGVQGATALVAMIEEKSQSEPKLKTMDQIATEIANKESQRERALDELGMFFKTPIYRQEKFLSREQNASAKTSLSPSKKALDSNSHLAAAPDASTDWHYAGRD